MQTLNEISGSGQRMMQRLLCLLGAVQKAQGLVSERKHQVGKMAATFTAQNAAPSFLAGKKIVVKARAAPIASRASVQVSAAASSSGRPLWAPGALCDLLR